MYKHKSDKKLKPYQFVQCELITIIITYCTPCSEFRNVLLIHVHVELLHHQNNNYVHVHDGNYIQ